MRFNRSTASCNSQDKWHYPQLELHEQRETLELRCAQKQKTKPPERNVSTPGFEPGSEPLHVLSN